MTRPDPSPEAPASRGRFLWNVAWKALLIFAAVNLLFAAFPPRLGRVSAYNLLFPGRARFPFGENPERAFNFTLNDLDALYASHEVARPRAARELRVVVLGDSSMWGTLLRPEETFAGQLEEVLRQAECPAPAAGGDAPLVQVYNLGYPTLSLTKDLLILEQVLEEADPDLIVWAVTLESMPRFRQADSPVVAANAGRLRALRQRTGLEIYIDEPAPSPFTATLAGQRRALSDWVRLQLYGLMWAATGVDQYYPASYEPAARNLEPEASYYDWPGPDLPPDALALDALAAGVKLAGEAGVPLLLVNEPVLASSGENSHVRYNFYYPRWAYDQYRLILQGVAEGLDWNYVDAWDVVPGAEFTNSAIHLTPEGNRLLVEAVAPAAHALICQPAEPEGEEPPAEETPGPARPTEPGSVPGYPGPDGALPTSPAGPTPGATPTVPAGATQPGYPADQPDDELEETAPTDAPTEAPPPDEGYP